jgi:hypothetical protein
MQPRRRRVSSARPYERNGGIAAPQLTHTVLEDHGVHKRTPPPGYVILKLYVFCCAHPKSKKTGLKVVYSQRYYPGHRDLQLERAADTLLKDTHLGDL